MNLFLGKARYTDRIPVNMLYMANPVHNINFIAGIDLLIYF